jgi:hypothetical protein
MKRGAKPPLPSTKVARGTYKRSRDLGKFELIPPDAMPVRPAWLTAAGEEVWIDNVGRAMPPLTEADSVVFAIFCNTVGAIGQAYMSGGVPPVAAQAEARRLGELFGLAGALSRVGREGAPKEPNPFLNRFKDEPAKPPSK